MRRAIILFPVIVCVRRACALSHSQRTTSNMPLYRPITFESVQYFEIRSIFSNARETSE